MTPAQEEFLGKLHIALARCVHDGHDEWAKALGEVVKYIEQDEPVMAVLEAEANGFDETIVEALRKTFDVRKWS